MRLGDKVKDIVTGFEGVIIGEFRWLNGCVRFGVQSQKLTKEGLPRESQTFDEQQLRLVKAGEVVVESRATVGASEDVEQPRRTGGPMPEPRRQADPGR